MRRKWLFIGPAALVGIVLFVAVGGGIVMQLWNWLLPSLFGVRPITFWQALGLLALCRILFGGFGGHRSVRGRFGERMAARWGAMTPEERDRVRQAMRRRCGFGPAAGETSGPVL
jgi:hypothetical protein